MSKNIPIWLCLIISFLVGALGFFAGVASMGEGRGLLSDMFATESPAKTSNPRSIKRPTYSLDFPSNWKLDKEDPEFDLDHYLTIESPGTSYVWLSFTGTEMSPEENVDFQVEQFAETVRAMKVTDFSKYGNLEGAGKRITGRSFSLRVEINIFSVLEGEVGLTIVEFAYVDDLLMSKPGFDLVRKSLRLIPQPEG